MVTGGTALLWAASVGSLDSVKLMVAKVLSCAYPLFVPTPVRLCLNPHVILKGADCNSQQGFGFTPLMEAASQALSPALIMILALVWPSTSNP